MPSRIRHLIDRLRGEGVGAVLARGASAFLAIHVAGVGLGLGVQVVLARALGAEQYGTYVWVYSWMLLLLLLCRLGLGTASLRFVAAFVAREDWARLRGYLRAAGLAVAGASLLVAAATAVVVGLLGERLPEATRQTFFVVCLALPVYAFLQVGGFVLRGFKRVLASQVPSTLLLPALLGLGAGGLWLGAPGVLDAPRAMLLNLGAACVALIVVGLAFQRTRPEASRRVPPRSERLHWMQVAAPLLLLNALHVTIDRVDILFVGALLDSRSAGLYAPATRIAAATAFGLIAVNAWAAPLISELHARGDHPGLQRLVRLAARGIFAFTLPLFVGVVLFGRQLLGLFGPEFAIAYVPLVVLTAGQLVNALVGPVGFLLTMTGRQTTAARILAVHAVIDVALNAVLIPRFGIVGAAVATGVTRASWNLVMAVQVWRTMRVRATIL